MLKMEFGHGPGGILWSHSLYNLADRIRSIIRPQRSAQCTCTWTWHKLTTTAQTHKFINHKPKPDYNYSSKNIEMNVPIIVYYYTLFSTYYSMYSQCRKFLENNKPPCSHSYPYMMFLHLSNIFYFLKNGKIHFLESKEV